MKISIYTGKMLWAGLAIGVTISTAAAFYCFSGFHVNVTKSAPIGLWKTSPVPSGGLRRGDFVEVCPPPAPIVKHMAVNGYLDPGSCPGTNSVELLKPLAAMPGDVVIIKNGENVSVNGKVLPNTAASPAVPSINEGTYIVHSGEGWLFSSYNVKSFDSRYFGPVKLSSIKGVVSPVFVEGDVKKMTVSDL